ncbi:hypothetical protein SRB5_16530 [Streptomyces sp. RB5]|uniref:Uncharacterized protein n=1 Tax=Streptomyces smaragdinus TaxID=2585196 RepID=A0A7K0CFL3_9ACTN|nr:hypothetical protein [Streptomyces smaragdinus]MQY11534.1 hypothetical protein [Streptomyces smaragdinus]
MGLFDRLTGTKRPDSDVEPRPAAELRAALLALDSPDQPFTVRDGAPEEADVVAEWRMAEPRWRGIFYDSQLTRAFKIRMRLVPDDHLVRALDEHWEVKWIEGVPTLGEYGRGPAPTTSVHWTIGRGADGERETTETFRFESGTMKDPLRDTVLKHGWAWKGVLGKP